MSEVWTWLKDGKPGVGIGDATPHYDTALSEAEWHWRWDAMRGYCQHIEELLKKMEEQWIVDENAPLLCISEHDSKPQLIIVRNVFRIGKRQRPNAWIRFWQRFLLGWRWEAIEPEMDEIR